MDLRKLFIGLQKEIHASLVSTRESTAHGPAMGDASEIRWIETLRDYLPTRYDAEKAFVLDSRGHISEQIDVVIFDRYYSPFLFNHDGLKYVPAEGVFAVFEVKQTLNKQYIEYTGKKAASVRRLHRTSGPIAGVEGTLSGRRPGRIMAGILASDSAWNPPFGVPFRKAVQSQTGLRQIDVGCVISAGAINVTNGDGRVPTIAVSSRQTALVSFFLNLTARLQALGNPPSIVIDEYAKSLRTKPVS